MNRTAAGSRRVLFWLASGVFSLLIATGIALNHWFIDRQKSTAMTLNLMGRQRMLSQKMATEALALYLERPATAAPHARLTETRALFEHTFLALQRGGDVIVDGRAVFLPPVVYPEIRDLMRTYFPL